MTNEQKVIKNKIGLLKLAGNPPELHWSEK